MQCVAAITGFQGVHIDSGNAHTFQWRIFVKQVCDPASRQKRVVIRYGNTFQGGELKKIIVQGYLFQFEVPQWAPTPEYYKWKESRLTSYICQLSTSLQNQNAGSFPVLCRQLHIAEHLLL